jgi:AcrR family transcriptional regulator
MYVTSARLADMPTQAERSTATRRRLIDAAVDSLVEKGWAATTTVEVCKRADLTRGALIHHFPDLPSLLATALDTVLTQRLPAQPPEIASLTDLVDITWQRLSDRTFKAVLESWLAAANDPELGDVLLPVIADFAKLVSPDELPTGDLLADDERRAYYLTAREAMLGLATGRAMAHGRPLGHEALVLERLRAEARRLDGTR